MLDLLLPITLAQWKGIVKTAAAGELDRRRRTAQSDLINAEQYSQLENDNNLLKEQQFKKCCMQPIDNIFEPPGIIPSIVYNICFNSQQHKRQLFQR